MSVVRCPGLKAPAIRAAREYGMSRLASMADLGTREDSIRLLAWFRVHQSGDPRPEACTACQLVCAQATHAVGLHVGCGTSMAGTAGPQGHL